MKGAACLSSVLGGFAGLVLVLGVFIVILYHALIGCLFSVSDGVEIVGVLLDLVSCVILSFSKYHLAQGIITVLPYAGSLVGGGGSLVGPVVGVTVRTQNLIVAQFPCGGLKESLVAIVCFGGPHRGIVLVV